MWWGLLREINQNTPHQAELIKLPSPEASFWDLIASYKQFTQLDLAYFDLVISGKYPAWMVRHERHICYMLHRLRGLYDTYHFLGLPDAYKTQHPGVVGFQAFMRQTGTRGSLPEFFARLESLGADASVPIEAFAFPGAFVREIIHYLDGIGLEQHAINKYAAISSTVAKRKGYFPPSANVDVIYPPSNLNGFHCAGDDYFFTVSRLDEPKRIGLLIEAMRHVKSNAQLKIAGTGPDEERLKQLAGGDPRIEFLGFVNDREIIGLYANALAVPYVPCDEDYGLVTIEAMMSGKPVLTVTDSGGPTEFVKNGLTGFCVSPNAETLAERLDYLCAHRVECRHMGQEGRKLVSNIAWGITTSRLLGESENTKAISLAHPRRKRLTVAVTFPIYPPRGGGQSRVFHLYRHLAKWWDIEVVTFTGAGDTYFEGEIAPGLREIRIPKSQEHETQELKLSEAAGWVPITDVAMPRLHALTPDYATALRDSAAQADVLVACHPYLVDALLGAAPGKPMWYEAQDVEADLKVKILGDSVVAKELLAETRAAEARCWKNAKVAYACSNADLERLGQLYGNTAALMLEVPNGVSLEDVPFTPPFERQTLRKRMGIGDAKIALFMGSWHGPNLEAVEHIIRFARKLPAVSFLILGSGGLAFNNQLLPRNVGILGVVDDEVKSVVLSMATVALNPMTSGSGTNLKMLDYFAAGLPVVSTAFGARGLGCQPARELLIAEIEDFADAISQLLSLPEDALRRMTSCAREATINEFDWAKIAKRFYDRV